MPFKENDDMLNRTNEILTTFVDRVCKPAAEVLKDNASQIEVEGDSNCSVTLGLLLGVGTILLATQVPAEAPIEEHEAQVMLLASVLSLLQVVIAGIEAANSAASPEKAKPKTKNK